MTARQIAAALVVFIVVIILLSWIVNAAGHAVPKEQTNDEKYIPSIGFTTNDIIELEHLI